MASNIRVECDEMIKFSMNLAPEMSYLDIFVAKWVDEKLVVSLTSS